MTDLELQKNIYDWAWNTLNINNMLDIEVIFGEQNSPRPTPPYMVIHRPFGTRKIGRASKGYTDETGNVQIVTNYVATVTIEVVGAETDYLRMLIDSLETQCSIDFLHSRSIAVLRNEDIQPIPDNTENQWEMRAMLDIFVAYPHCIEEYTGYINDIDYTNNI